LVIRGVLIGLLAAGVVLTVSVVVSGWDELSWGWTWVIAVAAFIGCLVGGLRRSRQERHPAHAR
jgi:hypothetical protein